MLITVFNKWPVLKLLPFIILGFLIYSNTWEVPFYFDDIGNINENENIRLTRLNLKDIINAGISKFCPHRPIANISFALNYFFHQYNVKGYHAVNIFIHILTGIFLCLFIETTLSISLLRSKDANHSLIAFFSALVWLVHPMHTQSVTYIVQRMNSLAAMFYILSILFYVKGRIAREKQKSWPYFTGCVVAGLLSIGCKEMAATLPFFILLYEWYFIQDLSLTWLRRHLPYIISITIIFILFSFIYLGLNPLEKILGGYARRDFTIEQRVLTQFRVVIYYVSLLFYPHPSRLNLDHYFPLSHSLIDPITTLLSMASIFVLIGLAFYIAKRERLISFIILWFFGNLVIESSIISLEIIFEHRTYLPSMLFFLIPIILAYRYIRRDWVIAGALCTAIVLFCLWSYKRNSVWRNPVTFWEDCTEKSEQKARPHFNLANALSREGRLDEATDHYYKVLQIKKGHVKAHNNLGNVLTRQGKLDEAITHFSKALRHMPQNIISLYNLGNVLAEQGKIDEAISHFSEVLRIDPDFELAHNELGIILAEHGKFEEAIDHFSEALRINPDYAMAHYNLANVLKEKDKIDEAISHLYKALRLDPDIEVTHNDLGIILVEQGKLEEAIDHFSEALQINPDYAMAHQNIGNSLVKQGKFEEAIDHFSEALRIDPDLEVTHSNLGSILAGQGKLEEAISHYSEALRINPDYAMAHFNLGSILAEKGKFEEAIDHFSEALRIDPNFASARSNLEKTLQKYR